MDLTGNRWKVGLTKWICLEGTEMVSQFDHAKHQFEHKKVVSVIQ